VRRFVRWLILERARGKARERRQAKAVERTASQRSKRERVRKEHTARREAAERAKLNAAEAKRREEIRYSREAKVALSLLSRPELISEAAAVAEAAQDARVAAAAALPDAIKLARPGNGLWDQFGGSQVEELLDDVDLVDGRWLVDLAEAGGVVPRGQDVPPSARIRRQGAWRLSFSWHEYDSLPVLVLSYPWLDKEHPDRLGEQLRRVAPFLRALLSACASEHGTVGVMWDFCSLPQAPRTADESDRFRRGLRRMNAWYMHPYTHVLLLASSLPRSVPYTNTRSWEARGWCFFEGCAAALVKHEYCLWDDRFFDYGALEPVAPRAIPPTLLADDADCSADSGKGAAAAPIAAPATAPPGMSVPAAGATAPASTASNNLADVSSSSSAAAPAAADAADAPATGGQTPATFDPATATARDRPVSLAVAAPGTPPPQLSEPSAELTLRVGASRQLGWLRQTLRAGRRSPLSPTEFAAEMQQRVSGGSLGFTSGADMQMVIQLYEAGFVAAFDTFPHLSKLHNIISFSSLGFGDGGQAQQLTNALTFVAEHCTFPHGPVRVSAEANGFTAADKAAMRQAVKDCNGVQALYL
jgi:hypothetical protein